MLVRVLVFLAALGLGAYQLHLGLYGWAAGVVVLLGIGAAITLLTYLFSDN